VAALASWLDARAHGGRWLVRIEDVDTPRTVPGATAHILQQLNDCALVSDEPVVLQSARSALYQQALDGLIARGLAYPCTCSRKDIAAALQQLGRMRPRHGELVYPGTCRPHAAPLAGTTQPPPRPDHGACAWRLRTDVHMENNVVAPVESAQGTIKTIAYPVIHWQDRRLGAQHQDVAGEVGDFVLKRADGCFTYQLAVVVDDAAQGITHVVRGVDLADNTARQILLARTLGQPTPQYLHTPLVLGANGEKLSKQNGALALDTATPQSALAVLRSAARVLGLPETGHTGIADALAAWIPAWRALSQGAPTAWIVSEQPSGSRTPCRETSR
jgi:glutamyl-Q tRNA(Asp) synthetase